jgi:LemA protein
MVTVAAMRTGVAIVRERDVATMTNIDRQDSEIVRDVVAIAERHPELRVGQNYQQVQASVVDAEDRLALARSFYNDSVTLYMDRRTQLPASLVAGILGFQPATLYWSGRIGEEDA